MSSFSTWKWRIKENERAVFLPLLSLLISLNWYILHVYTRSFPDIDSVFLNICFVYAGLFGYFIIRTCLYGDLSVMWGSGSCVGASPTSSWLFKSKLLSRGLILSALASFCVSIWFLNARSRYKQTDSVHNQIYRLLDGENMDMTTTSVRCDALMGFSLVMHSVATVLTVDQLGCHVNVVHCTSLGFAVCWVAILVSVLGLDWCA